MKKPSAKSLKLSLILIVFIFLSIGCVAVVMHFKSTFTSVGNTSDQKISVVASSPILSVHSAVPLTVAPTILPSKGTENSISLTPSPIKTSQTPITLPTLTVTPVVSSTWTNGETITTANNNQTVTMHNGQTMNINLGSNYNKIVESDPTILAQTTLPSATLSQGSYQADKTGQTILTSSGTLTCAKTPVHCMAIAEITFTLTVNVLP